MPKPKNPLLPTNSAVALKYNPDRDYSPVVVASGHGKAAERIISLADESGVPIYRDDSAAALLSMLEVGQGIPPELFQVVAGIYVEIMKLASDDKKKATGL
ncbi:MAG: EscU/YscU/HrcU family type III secretion system export apparatus switch protein [Oscillospiraceae bacterium]|nr:EscU/YscU/HrcU family type III secretion system export apparatus switch protein [Oscillospiraceae bacterium]MBQ4311670.1 EscU/YscU/HrcU family type III secretion system export apparatus switch protein [Oscillospiraceae bacterium]MBQ5417505.1 EscU/YscU/HrcU family type III secretion system export apparatus switch protein [Oscillospiraceae bacterium]MCR5167821.1 EscU/YscU/HrcU family type III secretion system export apparatus switch protein [Oscillospiraceae bacterium]